MSGGPTLVVRYDVGGAHWGRNCQQVAEAIAAGNMPAARVLDSKWSHPEESWREKGGGWPRPDLTPSERSTLKILRAFHDAGADLPHAVADELFAIVDRHLQGAR